MEDIFQKDLSGEMVSPDEPGYNDLINAIWDTMRLADELNTGHHTPDEVRDFLSRITGREIDPSDIRQEHPNREAVLDPAGLHFLRQGRHHLGQ